MKIQINSLEALERLIGGDTDVEIQVRNSVVQAFTNKHLKGIAKEYVENGLEEAVKKYVATDLFTYQSGWNSYYKLHDNYKPVVRQMIDEQVKELIKEDVKQQTESSNISSLVERYVQQAVIIAVREVTKTLIEEEAKKQIKAKFG